MKTPKRLTFSGHPRHFEGEGFALISSKIWVGDPLPNPTQIRRSWERKGYLKTKDESTATPSSAQKLYDMLQLYIPIPSMFAKNLLCAGRMFKDCMIHLSSV